MATSSLKRFSSCAFSALDGALSKLGYHVKRFDQMDFFEPLLYRRLAKSPDFFFVQIGANDGVFADPIRHFVTRNQVAGLAVEPLTDVFAQLVANYRDFPKVRPVNVALHQTARTIELHRVDPVKGAQLGDWTRGIASVKKSHHAVNEVPAEVMISEIVNCVTLMELLEKHQVRSLDLLQIDTEGYDSEILKMIDFQRIKPALIHFEHGLSDETMSVAELKECVGLLMDQGYLVVTEPYDATAYLPAMI